MPVHLIVSYFLTMQAPVYLNENFQNS